MERSPTEFHRQLRASHHSTQHVLPIRLVGRAFVIFIRAERWSSGVISACYAFSYSILSQRMYWLTLWNPDGVYEPSGFA